jgi:hypothetical protein
VIQTATAYPAAGAVPEVGVYAGVPAETYHSWKAASNSALSKIHDGTPAHLKAERERPRAQTPAMLLGSATHLAVLEPHLFADLYVRGPDGDGRTKAVQDAKRALAEQYPLATLLSPSDFDACQAMCAAVRRHPAASALLKVAESFELSLVWDEDPDAWEYLQPGGAVRCKLRADAWAPAIQTIIDLKTTESAGPESFSRSLANYGYARQAALYPRGFAANGLEVLDFAHIVVEKQYPNEVAVYRVDDVSLHAGAKQTRDLLRTYRQCERTGIWSGYSEGITDIGLPSYELAKIGF